MSDGSEIEHIWQTIYRIGFYRGGPVLMSALSGASEVCFSGAGMLILRIGRYFALGSQGEEVGCADLSVAWWEGER
jgi:hypothetical protein